MTYDDWKLRSDRDEYPGEAPVRCETCGHPEGYCDCPCCVEPECPHGNPMKAGRPCAPPVKEGQERRPKD